MAFDGAVRQAHNPCSHGSGSRLASTPRQMRHLQSSGTVDFPSILGTVRRMVCCQILRRLLNPAGSCVYGTGTKSYMLTSLVGSTG